MVAGPAVAISIPSWPPSRRPCDAAFRLLVLPAIYVPAALGDQRNVEGVRLFDLPVAAQIAFLRLEVDEFRLCTEPGQLDRELHARRIDRLAALVGVDAKFGRHASLEDRDLDRKGALSEHPTAVRPFARWLVRCAASSRCGRAYPPLARAAACEERRDDASHDNAHRRQPFCALHPCGSLVGCLSSDPPTSRSRSLTPRW